MTWKSGIPQVLLAGICFGFLGIFGRFAERLGLGIGEFLSFRFFLAAALLLIYFLLFNRRLLLLSRKEIFHSLLLGVFGYAIFSTLYFTAIGGMSVGLAALLLYTFPIWVSLGEHLFFQNKLSQNEWLALAITFSGLIFVLKDELHIEGWKPIAYGLASGITYAAYVMVSSRWQKNTPPLSSSFYVILSAGITLSLFHQVDVTEVSRLTSAQYALITGIALISTIAPLTLFLSGLQKMKSSTASVLVMIEPVIAVVLAYVILEETLNTQQMIGSAVVIFGLIFNSKSKPIHN